MNRRKFLQFLGFTSAAAVASTATAKQAHHALQPQDRESLLDSVFDITPDADTPFAKGIASSQPWQAFGVPASGHYGKVKLWWDIPPYVDVKQFCLYVDRGDGFQIEMHIPPHHNGASISDEPKVQRVMMTSIDSAGVPRDVYLQGDIAP